MQSERAPVLRFTVGASILCVLSMLAFGRLILETKAQQTARQEMVRRQARVDAMNEQLAELQAKFAQLKTEDIGGCAFGASREPGLLREQLDDLRKERERAIEQIQRCRHTPGCESYSPLY